MCNLLPDFTESSRHWLNRVIFFLFIFKLKIRFRLVVSLFIVVDDRRAYINFFVKQLSVAWINVECFSIKAFAFENRSQPKSSRNREFQ
jgi:hypothetical protein